MKNNKRVKVLLNVVQLIYDKNPEIQGVIDASMTEVCAGEEVSPQQVFLFFLCCCLYHNSYSTKKI